MGDTDVTVDPTEALADIQTLARVALQSATLSSCGAT